MTHSFLNIKKKPQVNFLYIQKPESTEFSVGGKLIFQGCKGMEKS